MFWFICRSAKNQDSWFIIDIKNSSICPSCLLPFVSSRPLWRGSLFTPFLSSNYFLSFNPVPPVTILLAPTLPTPLNSQFCFCGGVSPVHMVVHMVHMVHSVVHMVHMVHIVVHMVGGFSPRSIGARPTVHTSPILSTCTAITDNTLNHPHSVWVFSFFSNFGLLS